jgi:hypothetical protein
LIILFIIAWFVGFFIIFFPDFGGSDSGLSRHSLNVGGLTTPSCHAVALWRRRKLLPAARLRQAYGVAGRFIGGGPVLVKVI